MTIGKATSKIASPIRAYTPVVFAFLIFSSSPYDVVYCTPEYTIAPIAKSAPNAITLSQTVTINFLMLSIPIHELGSIAFCGLLAQPTRNCAAAPVEFGLQSAYDTNGNISDVRVIIRAKKQNIRIFLYKLDTKTRNNINQCI